MKNENQDYVKLGITGIVTITASLLCFFLLFRISTVFQAVQSVLNILAPFLYGAVIAYILAPVCSRLEQWIKKALPQSGRLSGALSIAFAILFALALVAALVVLVFPQVWDLGIWAVLPGQLGAAIDWFHDFLDNQPELQAWWDGFSSEIILKIEAWVQADPLPTAQLASFVLL